VIETLVSAAKQRGEESLVITFWPHPRMVLQNEARNLRLLTSLGEKKRKLLDLGVDRVEVIDFTKDFSRMGAEEYLRSVVKERFGATAVLLGYDNRIGGDHKTSEEAAQLASAIGLDVIRTESVSAGDVVVSSTRIREALSAGDVVFAADMLGYSYQLHGVVVAGNQLGRKMGYPTANMQLYEPLKLVPANGVYLVEVETVGESYYGMTNIGVRPTVGTANVRTIETNIFDFDQDIYGLDIRIRFIRKIRDERRFSSLEELNVQLRSDEQLCRSFL